MTAVWAFVLVSFLVPFSMMWGHRQVSAEERKGYVVQIAELEIDPAQIEPYKAALTQEIETSIRVEPGVLTLYAVSLKDHPEQVRLFETYRDDAAYQAHLQTAHFKTYKARTLEMVKSLRLIKTEPIRLGSKSDPT